MADDKKTGERWVQSKRKVGMVEERGVLFLRNRRDRSAEIVPGSENDVKVGRRRSKRRV